MCCFCCLCRCVVVSGGVSGGDGVVACSFIVVCLSLFLGVCCCLRCLCWRVVVGGGGIGVCLKLL